MYHTSKAEDLISRCKIPTASDFHAGPLYQIHLPGIIIVPYHSLDFFFCLSQVLNDQNSELLKQRWQRFCIAWKPAGILRQLVWRLFLDPAMQSARYCLFDKYKIDAVRYGRGSLREQVSAASAVSGRNHNAKTAVCGKILQKAKIHQYSIIIYWGK